MSWEGELILAWPPGDPDLQAQDAAQAQLCWKSDWRPCGGKQREANCSGSWLFTALTGKCGLWDGDVPTVKGAQSTKKKRLCACNQWSPPSLAEAAWFPPCSFIVNATFCLDWGTF